MLCWLLLENHFSDTTHPRRSFWNTGLKLWCQQLKEEETFLPWHGTVLSAGSQPHRAALMELGLSYWILVAQSLYDFTNKGENHRRWCCPSSGYPADCLVMVSIRTTRDKPGEWHLCLYVPCIVAHRIQERILGHLKELNPIFNSQVAWNSQECTRPEVKLSHVDNNF